MGLGRIPGHVQWDVVLGAEAVRIPGILHGLGFSRMFTAACQKWSGVKHVPGEPASHKQMMGWSSGEKVPLISEKILDGIVLKDPMRRGFPFLNKGEKFKHGGMT